MTASPIVFAGPSLTVPAPVGFETRPPAAAGDLLSLAAGRPRTVILIDGVFDASAAVQHKEILELLARGFAVIGGASMGALRAAELHRFGVTGIGAVFAAYAAGRLIADDEVALLHAPAELCYRPLTEALVDMRATLAAAATARVIDVATARAIRDRAKRRFWRERTWPTILDDCRDRIDDEMLKRFDAWLSRGRISIKARDAQLCLAAACSIKMPIAGAPPPRTAFFQALARSRGVIL